MAKDLTESFSDRQNILNNSYAMLQAEQYLELGGFQFDGETVFTKQQALELFAISHDTLKSYLSSYHDELTANGYTILSGAKHKRFKELDFAPLIDEGTKNTSLGIFTFRAILNLAMLLTDNAQAKELRSRILDIMLDVQALRTGGHTRFINQSNLDYQVAAPQDHNNSRNFIKTLNKHVMSYKWQYDHFSKLIYHSFFDEHACEYRKILELAVNEVFSKSIYAEVLSLIDSFQLAIAQAVEKRSTSLGRRLTQSEAEMIFNSFEQDPLNRPLISEARSKMASCDMCFKDVLHEQQEAYYKAVSRLDFDCYLDEKRRSLEVKLSDPETLSVFKRLKSR